MIHLRCARAFCRCGSHSRRPRPAHRRQSSSCDGWRRRSIPCSRGGSARRVGHGDCRRGPGRTVPCGGGKGCRPGRYGCARTAAKVGPGRRWPHPRTCLLGGVGGYNMVCVGLRRLSSAVVRACWTSTVALTRSVGASHGQSVADSGGEAPLRGQGQREVPRERAAGCCSYLFAGVVAHRPRTITRTAGT